MYVYEPSDEVEILCKRISKMSETPNYMDEDDYWLTRKSLLRILVRDYFLDCKPCDLLSGLAEFLKEDV